MIRTAVTGDPHGGDPARQAGKQRGQPLPHPHLTLHGLTV